jgi:hypothetical protein
LVPLIEDDDSNAVVPNANPNVFGCPVGPIVFGKVRMFAETYIFQEIEEIIRHCPLGRQVLASMSMRFPDSCFQGSIITTMIRQLDNANIGNKLLTASNDLDTVIDNLSSTTSMAAYATIIRNQVAKFDIMIQQQYPEEEIQTHRGMSNAVSIIAACRIIDNMKQIPDMKTDTHWWITGTQKVSYGPDIYCLSELL